MQQSDLAVIILAAGKGTRMQTSLAKVLLPVAGHPLLHYVLDLSSRLNPARTIVVVGHQADQVKEAFAGGEIEFVVQNEQLGTGHAAQQAKSQLENFEGRVLVLCGDMPLIRLKTLLQMLEEHKNSGAKCTVLTLKSSEYHDFGRIIRDEDGSILKIGMVARLDPDKGHEDLIIAFSKLLCFSKTHLNSQHHYIVLFRYLLMANL